MFSNHQYDQDCITWSPGGRILQVEYAMEAVKQGTPVLGLRSNTHVVLCSYRLLFSPIYRRRLAQLSGLFAAVSLSDSAISRAPVDTTSLRSNTRRFRENPIEVGWKH